MPLLTQNRELKKIGVWNFTLPAWAGRLPDGRTYNTCPEAGAACRTLCYARVGTYTWPKVKAKHERNLMLVLDEPARFKAEMTAELGHRRFRDGGLIRWHDAGDFFSDDYLLMCLEIFRAHPHITFYAYTKSIERFRRLVEPDPPPNFRWIFSDGGTQDALIDITRDRVADVFPDEKAIEAAGFSSQEASDLLAAFGPPKVGIPANNIPHLKKLLGHRSMSQWQAEHEAAQAARHERRTTAQQQ